jgi:hypothetical protein
MAGVLSTKGYGKKRTYTMMTYESWLRRNSVRSRQGWWKWSVASILSFLAFPAQSLSLSSGAGWSGIFSGKTIEYQVLVTSESRTSALLTWQLVTKGRTLASGKKEVRFGHTDRTSLRLTLKTPPLKPGISLTARLLVEVEDSATPMKKARLEIPIKIFGPDPLLSAPGLRKDLHIHLYDPTGDTTHMLDTLNIPFQSSSKSRFLEADLGNLSIIGGGIALDEQRGLVNTLLEQARSGRRVLILEPISGSIPVPPSDTASQTLPPSLSFEQDRVTRRFAAGYPWATHPAESARGITLQPHRNSVSASITAREESTWAWMKLDFEASGGALIICMLPFAQAFDTGPIPQIIFGRLVAFAAGHPNQHSDPLTDKERLP